MLCVFEVVCVIRVCIVVCFCGVGPFSFEQVCVSVLFVRYCVKQCMQKNMCVSVCVCVCVCVWVIACYESVRSFFVSFCFVSLIARAFGFVCVCASEFLCMYVCAV